MKSGPTVATTLHRCDLWSTFSFEGEEDIVSGETDTGNATPVLLDGEAASREDLVVIAPRGRAHIDALVAVELAQELCPHTQRAGAGEGLRTHDAPLSHCRAVPKGQALRVLAEIREACDGQVLLQPRGAVSQLLGTQLI